MNIRSQSNYLGTERQEKNLQLNMMSNMGHTHSQKSLKVFFKGFKQKNQSKKVFLIAWYFQIGSICWQRADAWLFKEMTYCFMLVAWTTFLRGPAMEQSNGFCGQHVTSVWWQCCLAESLELGWWAQLPKLVVSIPPPYWKAECGRDHKQSCSTGTSLAPLIFQNPGLKNDYRYTIKIHSNKNKPPNKSQCLL